MNRQNYLLIVFFILPILLSACVTSGPTRNTKPVPAGFLYKGDYINVRSPNSDGWHLVQSSPEGMAFAKGGANPGESFGAQLLMFPLTPTKTKDEFVSLIKQGYKNDTDTERFKSIESEFKYSEKRSYPCVEVTSVVEDKNAQTSPTQREVLLLQAKALYCRHPERQATGFSISYSHRGKTLYSSLDAEGKSFIDGLQVPGH